MKYSFSLLLIVLLCFQVNNAKRYYRPRSGNNFFGPKPVTNENQNEETNRNSGDNKQPEAIREDKSNFQNRVDKPSFPALVEPPKLPTRADFPKFQYRSITPKFPGNSRSTFARNDPTPKNDLNKNFVSTTDSEYGIPEAINLFALRLFHTLSKFDSNENMCYSPIGITYAFSMLMLGAQKQTEQEVFNGLELNKIFKTPEQAHLAFKKYLKMVGNHQYSLDFVNLFLIQRDMKINQEYIDQLDKHYNVTFAKVDFARNQNNLMNYLNEWIRKVTKGKVENLLVKPLDISTKIAIFNVVYFKGFWLNGFHKNGTHKALFHASRERSDEVDFMMTLNEFPYYYNSEKGYKLLQLPYRGDVSFNILLPKRKYSLDQVMNSLTIDDLNAPLQKTKLELLLPKFKIEKDYDLKKILPQLGINAIFGDKADFSGINDDHSLKVNSGKHKSVIVVNEEGTEASAQTSITIASRTPQYNVVFNANHPFIFYIRNEKTGIMYFMGKLGDPSLLSKTQ